MVLDPQTEFLKFAGRNVVCDQPIGNVVGTEGEIRTLETSLEDSHVSSYITSAGEPSFEFRVQCFEAVVV